MLGEIFQDGFEIHSYIFKLKEERVNKTKAMDQGLA